MTMISGASKLAGVIGWPVSHSLSPRLHSFWLQHHQIDGVYVPLPVEADKVEAALRGLPALGFVGANVTVPHKEMVCRLVDERSAAASEIGAVNTLICRDDGTLVGDNTDAYGFIANLKAGAPNWQPTAGSALVLGAGGASRAVVWALLNEGVPEVHLCNRTQARADDLAAHFGAKVSVVEWDDRAAALKDSTLVVNTTTLGMTGKAPLDLPLAGLGADAVVTDIVYAPLHTPLLSDAQAAGHVTVDGLGMLLHQAVPGFEAWFGTRPEVTDALRDHVLQGLRAT